MIKRKRNLFSELMDGIDAMRAHRKECRNIGKEILDGVREIKRGQHGRIVSVSEIGVAKTVRYRSKRGSE